MLLLVSLSFFQHPSSDDFAGNLLTKSLGVRGAIGWYLSEQNGRFSSIPLFLLLSSSRFLLDHYFICLVFFLLLTYLSVWYFLKYVLKTFYTITKRPAYYHWLSAFSLLVLLACMPEPSSFFTWLATDATYLVAFILFPVYLVQLHRVLTAPAGRGAMGGRLALLLLLWVLSGTNEIALFFSFFFSLLFCGYRFWGLKDRSWLVMALPAMHVLIIILEFIASGNVHRSGAYVQKQFWLYSLGGAFYQAAQIFFPIFSNPLFWLSAGWMLYSSRHIKTTVLPVSGNRVALFALVLVVMFAAVLVLAFMARHLTGIVLPLRARNIIVCMVLPSVLAAAALLIGPLLRTMPSLAGKPGWKPFPWLAGLLVLVFNPFTAGLCQSLVDAPIHREVLDQRIALINEAKERGLQKVALPAYQDHFLATMKRAYGEKAALFCKIEFPAPPRFLYFLDDPSQRVTGSLYGEYYGIDTVESGSNVSVRMGLLPGIWQRAEGKSR